MKDLKFWFILCLCLIIGLCVITLLPTASPLVITVIVIIIKSINWSNKTFSISNLIKNVFICTIILLFKMILWPWFGLFLILVVVISALITSYDFKKHTFSPSEFIKDAIISIISFTFEHECGEIVASILNITLTILFSSL